MLTSQTFSSGLSDRLRRRWGPIALLQVTEAGENRSALVCRGPSALAFLIGSFPQNRSSPASADILLGKGISALSGFIFVQAASNAAPSSRLSKSCTAGTASPMTPGRRFLRSRIGWVTDRHSFRTRRCAVGRAVSVERAEDQGFKSPGSKRREVPNCLGHTIEHWLSWLWTRGSGDRSFPSKTYT